MKNLVLSDKELDILDYVLGEFSHLSRRMVTHRHQEFTPTEFQNLWTQVQTAFHTK